MNQHKKYILSAIIWMGIYSLDASAQLSISDFTNPPQEACPDTYWEWMNGNINKIGITKDLEYMHNANYGAAMIFEAGVGIPRGPVDVNSKEWTSSIIHSVQEAERLGMKISMHNSPGYSGTGGPWIPVEQSMKQLVWTDDIRSTDEKGRIVFFMEKPLSKMGFYRDAYVLAYPSLINETTDFQSNIKKISLGRKQIVPDILIDNDFSTAIRIDENQSVVIELCQPMILQSSAIYRGEREKPLDPHDGPRDYAPSLTLEVSDNGIDFTNVGKYNSPALRAMDVPSTIVFPIVKAKYIRLTSNRGSNLSEIKFSGITRLANYMAKNNALSSPVSLKNNKQNVSVSDIINHNSVIDITRFMDKDGNISWMPPHKGRWTIVRIGYTTTGEVVAAAPDSGIGLDCDKFSKEALDIHFDRYIDPLMEQLKPWLKSTVESLVIDSWEAGRQNWTKFLPEYFKSHRGYDIAPYLLAVTGRIIDNVNDTERFLWDFRRTHTDMFIENYICHFKERAGRYGLKYAGEAYGDGNFESLEMASFQDIPMCEYWTHHIYGNITTTMLAASAAHLWDKPIVACETYTGTPFNSKFTEHPYGMKVLADYIMTAGVNRIVYHATTHQPYVGKQSYNIMTMGPFGTHLNRNSTWADYFNLFNRYVSRCCNVLQQGTYVADILFLKDEAISSGVNNYNNTVPFGYRWDITDASGLRERVTAKNGKIVLPNGMSYSMIVVAPMPRTSPQTLEKLLYLKKNGVTVILPEEKPYGYLGLDADKDAQVIALADSLWSCNASNVGRKVKDALDGLKITPDFQYLAKNKDAQIHFIHRSVGSDDVYFISNHRRRPEEITIVCRISGKTPYLWDAESGKTMIPVPFERRDGKTIMNLNLMEAGSIFVVFKDVSDNSNETTISDVTPVSTTIYNKERRSIDYTEQSFNSTFSISLWAKPETHAVSSRGFILYPAAATGNRANVGISMGQNGIRIYERDSRNNMILEYLSPISGWTMLTLVYDNGKPTLFINGEKVAVGKKSNKDCCPAIDMPMAEEQFPCSFEGDHTPAIVYDYTLSEDEISKLYVQGLPNPTYIGTIFKELSDDWQLRFPPCSHAPENISLQTLMSLHKHTDFNIKHFSGTVKYIKHFSIGKKDFKLLSDRKTMLNLGRVENIAEIIVNGNPVDTLWKAPYSLDISGLLKKGGNEIIIKVTNLYPNRMIGDEHLPELYDYDEYGRIRKFPEWYLNNEYDNRQRIIFSPWKHYSSSDPLLEAGLLGPVTLSIK